MVLTTQIYHLQGILAWLNLQWKVKGNYNLCNFLDQVFQKILNYKMRLKIVQKTQFKNVNHQIKLVLHN